MYIYIQYIYNIYNIIYIIIFIYNIYLIIYIYIYIYIYICKSRAKPRCANPEREFRSSMEICICMYKYVDLNLQDELIVLKKTN